MTKLLTICPSRGRPEALKQMIESYLATKSEGTDLVIYLNEDDPKLPEYEKLGYTNYMKIGKRMYLAEAYNYFFNLFPDYDYYAPVNDDHVFVTPEWDKKLLEIVERNGQGWGIAAAEDKLTNWAQWQHPSGCVVSGNIPRTLGHFIWPKFQHIGIDDYFQWIAQGIKRLFHTTEVVIEHRHWINGKRLLDANYKWVYGQEQQGYGRKVTGEYFATQLAKDLTSLKQAMILDGIKL